MRLQSAPDGFDSNNDDTGSQDSGGDGEPQGLGDAGTISGVQSLLPDFWH
jgi:hypothetical protein